MNWGFFARKYQFITNFHRNSSASAQVKILPKENCCSKFQDKELCTEASQSFWFYYRQRPQPNFDASYRFLAPQITIFLSSNFNRMEKDLNFTNCSSVPIPKKKSLILNAGTFGEYSIRFNSRKGMHINSWQKITNPRLFKLVCSHSCVEMKSSWNLALTSTWY